MTKACDLTAIEARRQIGRKALSPVELLESCLERIDKVDPTLNAMVAIDREGAMQTAKDAEARVMAGDDLDLLHGLPVGIKDLNPVKGLRSTWGSLIHEHHVPEADDSMVANVRDCGGVIFAKTNTPEFGAGANTTNRVYGPTGNPFDPLRTCGGSSGGGAVALATGMAPLATGSDYGGSLRTPASFCGVAGYRPSPGLVPMPEAAVSLNPFSVGGPMGRTVADAHLLLLSQLDIDKRDPFSSSDVAAIPASLSGLDLGSLRIAATPDLGCAPVAKMIARVFEDRLKAFGHVFADVERRDPELDGVHDCFEVLRGVNFVGAHRDRLEKHRDLLDRNVIDNTERGLAYDLGDVARAHTTQSRIHRAFHDLFDDVDLLICPAAAVSPFPHSQLFIEEIDGEQMPTYMRWLAITYGLTMALPAVAVVPCGLDDEGMPFGLQIAGPAGSDALVLEAAHSLEQVLADIPETRRPIPDLAKLGA